MLAAPTAVITSTDRVAMAVSKSLILLLSVLAVAVAQSARVKKQVLLGPYGHVEDDGSYWPGKYPDDPVAAPVAAYPYAAPAPVAPYPYAAPAPVAPYPYAAPVAPYPYAAPVAYAPHEDDGSYHPGKYGPENPQ